MVQLLMYSSSVYWMYTMLCLSFPSESSISDIDHILNPRLVFSYDIVGG